MGGHGGHRIASRCLHVGRFRWLSRITRCCRRRLTRQPLLLSQKHLSPQTRLNTGVMPHEEGAVGAQRVSYGCGHVPAPYPTPVLYHRIQLPRQVLCVLEVRQRQQNLWGIRAPIQELAAAIRVFSPIPISLIHRSLQQRHNKSLVRTCVPLRSTHAAQLRRYVARRVKQ